MMNRPGPFIVDTAAIARGRMEADKRLLDYNENHDPKSGEFASAENGSASESNAGYRGGVEKNTFGYSKAFWPTVSEHVVALGAAKSTQQMSHELAALKKNTNLNVENLGKVVSRYTLKDPVSKTRGGLLKEIATHYHNAYTKAR